MKRPREEEYALSEEGEHIISRERLTDEILTTLLQSNTDDELKEVFPSILDRARLRTFYLNPQEGDVRVAAEALVELGGERKEGGRDKIYQCKLCKKPFSSSYGLKYHLDNQVCIKPPHLGFGKRKALIPVITASDILLGEDFPINGNP